MLEKKTEPQTDLTVARQTAGAKRAVLAGNHLPNYESKSFHLLHSSYKNSRAHLRSHGHSTASSVHGWGCGGTETHVPLSFPYNGYGTC